METNIIENADIRRFNISQRGEITKASIFLQVMAFYLAIIVTEKEKNKRDFGSTSITAARSWLQ